MSKKIIISFEGIEGSGKTYHIKNVSNHLKKNRVPHIKLREPGGSKNAEKIRKIILNKKNIFNNKYNLFKVIHYNYIIKKWGRVHKDLGTK